MPPQFIACSFQKGGGRYTYHNDGAPLAVGDKVNVPGRGTGPARVAIVEAVDVAKPAHFDTKAVLGLLETAAARAERKANGASA